MYFDCIILKKHQNKQQTLIKNTIFAKFGIYIKV